MEQIPVIRLPAGSSWPDVIKTYNAAKYYGLALYYAAIKIILPENMLPNFENFEAALHAVDDAVREKTDSPMVNIKYAKN